jgi:hypothetical protein
LLRQLLKARQGIRAHRDEAPGGPARIGRAPAASRSLEPSAHLSSQLYCPEVV